jgi:hypothetical protein
MIAIIKTMMKTTKEWEEENPVIPDDMLGIEKRNSGFYKIKRGDGVTAWDSLIYFIGAELSQEECAGIVDDYTVDQRSAIPAPNKTAMYNGDKGLKSDKTPAEDNDVVRLQELENADTAFQYSLDTEAQARADADTAFQYSLDTEAQTRADADTALQNNLDTEAQARADADTALQNNLDTEAQTRADADTALQNGLGDANAKISALNGAYFVLEPYNFGKNLDVLNNDDVLILNTYAVSQTPGASSTGDLNDNTVIINEFDNSEYIYNKQLGVWMFYSNGLISIATNQSLGVVKGVSDPGDKSADGKVTVTLNGEMKVIGFDDLKTEKLDIRQDPADAGKAMVIGGNGDLIPGVSGKVDGVDGVEPEPNTKNVKLTWIYETEGDYEADKDNIPEGARVIKLYEYPDNAVNDEDYFLGEIKTRGRWIDRKPIYKKTYQLTFTATPTFNLYTVDQSFFTLGKRLVKVEGFDNRDGTNWRPVPQHASSTEVMGIDSNEVYGLYIFAQEAAESFTHNVSLTVWYTKTTD